MKEMISQQVEPSSFVATLQKNTHFKNKQRGLNYAVQLQLYNK